MGALIAHLRRGAAPAREQGAPFARKAVASGAVPTGRAATRSNRTSRALASGLATPLRLRNPFTKNVILVHDACGAIGRRQASAGSRTLAATGRTQPQSASHGTRAAVPSPAGRRLENDAIVSRRGPPRSRQGDVATQGNVHARHRDATLVRRHWARARRAAQRQPGLSTIARTTRPGGRRPDATALAAKVPVECATRGHPLNAVRARPGALTASARASHSSEPCCIVAAHQALNLGPVGSRHAVQLMVVQPRTQRKHRSLAAPIPAPSRACGRVEGLAGGRTARTQEAPVLPRPQGVQPDMRAVRD